MRWLVFLILGLFTIHSSLIPVRADYSQAYYDYQFLYSKYRESFRDFTVAKATYFTYKTLTTQNEALEKMRGVLVDRANIISAYFILLAEKLVISEGVPPADSEAFDNMRQNQDNWLEKHIDLIESAATIDDLNDVSAEFDARYQQIVSQTNKTVAAILLAKNDAAYAKMPDLFSKTALQLGRLADVGEDNLTYFRGLDVAKSKAKLWEGKRLEVVDLMNPKQYSYQQTTDIGKIQNLLFGGLQYLKESTSYLKEITDTITRL
jgi:hypothetical protein